MGIFTSVVYVSPKNTVLACELKALGFVAAHSKHDNLHDAFSLSDTLFSRRFLHRSSPFIIRKVEKNWRGTNANWRRVVNLVSRFGDYKNAKQLEGFDAALERAAWPTSPVRPSWL